MHGTGVRKICFLKISINTAVYQDVIDNYLILYIKVKFQANEFIFQYNLAPLFTAKSSKNGSDRREYLFLIDLQIA